MQVKENSIRPWVYIISYVNRSQGFEAFFRELSRRNIYVHVIFLHWSLPEIKADLSGMGHHCYYIPYRGKSDLIPAFLRLLKLLHKLKPVLVHTHLFDATLMGVTAAKILGIRERMHTRHHASQHHVYNPETVKFDRWNNRLSTKIIAVSENIRNILLHQEHVDFAKVHVIHHGFDLSYFDEVDAEAVSGIKLKYNISGKSPVIGVISRYTHWKGIQFVIPAFARLLKDYPDAHLILANARGDYKAQILQLLKSLPESTYTQIEFEPEIQALYKTFDIFIHVPVDAHSEAFGQVYIEALAAGIPSVFTRSGIASEFISDHENALVVPFNESDPVYERMKELLANPELCRKLRANGKLAVRNMFDVKVMVDKTLAVYE